MCLEDSYSNSVLLDPVVFPPFSEQRRSFGKHSIYMIGQQSSPFRQRLLQMCKGTLSQNCNPGLKCWWIWSLFGRCQLAALGKQSLTQASNFESRLKIQGLLWDHHSYSTTWNSEYDLGTQRKYNLMQDRSSDVNTALASWPLICTVCLNPAVEYKEANYQVQTITT